MFKLLPAALVAGAVLSGSALAAAEPASPRPLLAIVDIEAPPNMTGLAAQVTRAVLDAAAAQGHPVVNPADIRQRLGEKNYAELQSCHGKTTCLGLRLAGFGAARVVVGTLGRDEKNYLVRLWLVDLSKGAVIADVDRSIFIASRRFIQDVNAALPGLLRGERESRGTLKLSSNVRSVAVTVDGEDQGLTPLTLELKPGKHEIRLEKKAYLPVERLVTIEPGRVTEESVRLIGIPGETPVEDLLPPMTAGVSRPADGRTLVPAGAWVAAGAALAATVAGAVFGSQSVKAEAALKQGFDPERNVYLGTREDALLARRNAQVANVCFATAGAALVTGVLLTVFSGGDRDPSPVATGSGGRLLLQGRF